MGLLDLNCRYNTIPYRQNEGCSYHVGRCPGGLCDSLTNYYLSNAGAVPLLGCYLSAHHMRFTDRAALCVPPTRMPIRVGRVNPAPPGLKGAEVRERSAATEQKKRGVNVPGPFSAQPKIRAKPIGGDAN